MKFVKKNVIVIFTSILICFTPLSAFNVQKIFRVDSQIYQTIKALYLYAGFSLPSASGPWSASELLLMLEKIPEENLP